ncbi:UNVERIFIED_CONTAM: hypothetical protein GTU68_026821 [Idotea baltica]|nr:hypothetical protein [Idotea baltica]MCL4125669.1 hypothetical protein [Idotea baltica]
MLLNSNHKESTFDDALFNILHPLISNPSLNILAEILRITKPGGQVILNCNSSELDITSQLKLAGYVDVSVNSCDGVKEIRANKPNFEVGSSMKLSLGTKGSNTEGGQESTWKIDLNDADVRLEDPDDLLSEEDLVKPDPASLKVCGTTGQRKACKNCVCGLKEELDAEAEQDIKAKQKEVKSSCGSCYLGDAFRCASCPYLGMPAFKPGEKVKLTDDTLQD